MNDYTRSISFTADLAGQAVRVISKPGLADFDQASPAVTLCARLLQPAPDERILLLGCGHGALGVALARMAPRGQIILSDPNLIAIRMARRTLEVNRISNARVTDAVSLLPGGTAGFDRVVILTPQARALSRRWIVEAHALLCPGGRLNLAGANNAGITPLISDASALFGSALILGYGGGGRVAELTRREDAPDPPAWSREPGIAPDSWTSVRLSLAGATRELASLPGIFSYDRLDAGSALLIAQLLGPKADASSLIPHASSLQRVLDIGCGYGPIGIAAALAGAAHVDMVDVNLLATRAAAENIARLGLRAEALLSDGLDALADRRYDLIVSNPPFHAGRQVDTAMAAAFIAQGRDHLAPGGSLVLVANRFLDYDRLLCAAFPRVLRLAESPAYHVIAGIA